MRPRWMAIWCGSLLGGCGPLHEAGYPGEPLYVLEGQARSTGEMEWLLGPASIDVPVTVGLFWARADRSSLQQQVGLTTAFPARYELALYEPPPDDTLLQLDWVSQGGVALGLPVLFLDDDGDGVRSDDEPLVGNAQGFHVLYAERESTIESPQGTVDLAAGFQRIWAQDTTCDLEGVPVGLQLVPEDIPTDLLIGPWFVQLIDIDCDGSSDEWSECPTGEYLAQWCEQARRTPMVHPCLDACGGPL
ncbi:MAG: hypothetical protein KTR31_41985 [Myxococcales bacterium]|nr:hypothetical protein [Myxococcales bacterium]